MDVISYQVWFLITSDKHCTKILTLQETYDEIKTKGYTFLRVSDIDLKNPAFMFI